MPQKDKTKVAVIADQILSDPLFPSNTSSDKSATSKEVQTQKDPLASQVWRMYTKAKDTLPNGSRLENLTWRMMAMSLKSKKKDDNIDEGDAMVVDDTPEPAPATSQTSIDISTSSTGNPPSPDDTVGLLSSSAPPYMMDFLREEHERKNVMVTGSSRADIMHQYMVRGLVKVA